MFGLAVGDRRPLLGLECFTCEPAPIDGEVTVTGIVRLASDLVADPSTQGLFLTASSFIDGAWTESARPGTILWIHVDGIGGSGRGHATTVDDGVQR